MKKTYKYIRVATLRIRNSQTRRQTQDKTSWTELGLSPGSDSSTAKTNWVRFEGQVNLFKIILKYSKKNFELFKIIPSKKCFYWRYHPHQYYCIVCKSLTSLVKIIFILESIQSPRNIRNLGTQFLRNVSKSEEGLARKSRINNLIKILIEKQIPLFSCNEQLKKWRCH